MPPVPDLASTAFAAAGKRRVGSAGSRLGSARATTGPRASSRRRGGMGSATAQPSQLAPLVWNAARTPTRFLATGLADELQQVIAPFFIGDPDAPRFVSAAAFPWASGHRMELAEARPIGDVVLLSYLVYSRALGEQSAAAS